MLSEQQHLAHQEELSQPSATDNHLTSARLSLLSSSRKRIESPLCPQGTVRRTPHARTQRRVAVSRVSRTPRTPQLIELTNPNLLRHRVLARSGTYSPTLAPSELLSVTCAECLVRSRQRSAPGLGASLVDEIAPFPARFPKKQRFGCPSFNWLNSSPSSYPRTDTAMTIPLDRPAYPPFEHVKPTEADLPFIKLGVVDLSRYVEGPEGLASRQALAADLEDAVSKQGFFFLEGHGYPKEQLDYLQAISQAILDLPLDQKTEYSAGAQNSEDDAVADTSKFGAERGTGFKVRGYWGMQHGVRDQIEHYNWRNLLHPTIRDGQTYPPLVRQHLPEVVDYISYLHYDVIRKLSSLFDIILEVPEGTFWSLCNVTPDVPDDSAGGFARAMLYNPMPEEDEKKTANTWLRGHSDASFLTFITSQPMASLQVRDYKDGEWKWVGYRENALVVNVADCLEFLSGSYFKSTIHRVVSPPDDQKGHRRLGFIYFSAFKPHVVVDPSTLKSPKLDRLGITKPDSWDLITAREWEDRKVKTFGKKAINANEGDEPIPFYINGRAAERWHQLGK